MDNIETAPETDAFGNEVADIVREKYAALKVIKATARPCNLLKICPVQLPWRWLPYSQLMQMIDNGLQQTQLVIEFPVAVVFIHGRKLKALAHAIEERACEMIQAYDATRWDKPIGEHLPFIERIDILEPRSPEALARIAAIGIAG